MREKFLVGLMTIGIVVSMLGTGTFAYFSDTEISTNNMFTVGIIDLSAPFDIEYSLGDLKPCLTRYLTLKIQNDADCEMDVWKHIKNVVCNENDITEPEQEYYTEHGIGTNGKNDIDSVILYDLWLDNDGDINSCDEGQGDVWIIKESEGYHIDDIQCHYIYLGNLVPGEIFTIVQSYHMEADTENWAQSDIITFDIEFFAQQSDCNPPPAEPLIRKTPKIPTYSIQAKFNHPGPDSYWKITLSNTGQSGPPVNSDDFNVWDGIWVGWCFDESHYINNGATHTVTLWSSYDAGMPSYLQDPDWPYVNWIINNKGTANKNQIQSAIWYFINGGWAPYDNPGHINYDPVIQALIDGAKNNPLGINYCPSENELFAIICNAGENIQKTFIEVDP